jgi:hypothetical protein
VIENADTSGHKAVKEITKKKRQKKTKNKR